MQFECAALDQDRLESLDPQAVQGRRTVQQDRMILDDDFQCVPNLVLGAFHHLAGGFDIIGNAGFHQPFHHERLEQLQGHFFRQAALIHLQIRADDDNRTAGVVHTLTQQVLPETALFALEHIRQGFQRAVIRPGDRPAAAAVVDQGVYRLLKSRTVRRPTGPSGGYPAG